MLSGLFKTRPETTAGRRLYAEAVAQARRPEFYTEMGVDDRIDGRFELCTLHVALLADRLRTGGERGRDTSQALFDAYIAALDDALREIGVGDLSVAKKMRKLGEAVYGRMKAIGEALSPEPDLAAVQALVARSVFGDETATHRAEPLARYVVQASQALKAADTDAIIDAGALWPEPGR
jgi:cytochrome b pre-mRNA-processing protein 3